MKSTDILDTLLKALDDSAFAKNTINNFDKLLSGEAYEKFMTVEVTPAMLPEIIVGATPVLEPIYLLTDKILAEMTPDLRSRILNYLERCRELYIAAVAMLEDKVRTTTSSPKCPEEMTREELLAYIKEQLN